MKDYSNTMFMTTSGGIGILINYNELMKQYDCYNVIVGDWFKVNAYIASIHFSNGFWYIP